MTLRSTLRKWALLFLVGSVTLACRGENTMTREDPSFDAELVLDAACQRMGDDLGRTVSENALPRSVQPDGSLRLVPASDWTSGFYPGLLWLFFEHCGDDLFRAAAERWTAVLESQKDNAGTHDIGFMVYSSFGNAYRLTSDTTYRDVFVHAARTLSTRFDERVGMIKSWDHGRWQYPVIVDNMMNLELLFAATRESGDSTFYEIARRHADNTIRHHYRDDYSSFHVVDFDTLTGEVLEKRTHQGYADESSWSRGQSWGLYGFTMVYRETDDPQYLAHARGIADFLLAHPNLPGDGVPYWDYNAPHIPDEPRDVSAAAIMASALLELAAYAPDDKERYVAGANRILTSLSGPPYVATDTTPLPFLISHSVGNRNVDSEVAVPIIYADYYYVEALLRKLRGPVGSG
jgi:hypothetical protein